MVAKINEVAQAAGVSISTVSYALSGKRPVSPETRRRIEQAVSDLGYSPNAGARMLAGSRTHIFALTEPLRRDTHAPTHMSFVLATAVAARRSDYDVLLLTDEQASAGMARVAASGLVDAILVLDVAPDDERVDLARSIDTPSIFIGVPNDHEGLVCVDLDFEAATMLAVDRVADAGHHAVGLIGQPQVAYEKSNFPPRVRGAFERRAGARGLAYDFRVSGDRMPNADVTREAVGSLLDAGATALLVHGTDDVHHAVLAEIADRGLSIPGDLSIVSIAASFDTSVLPIEIDVIPLMAEPSCDLAVELAVRSLTPERPEPGLHLLTPVYYDRKSVTSPPGSRRA